MTFFYPAVKNLSITARKRRDRANPGDSHLEDLDAPISMEASPDLGDALKILSDAHREIVVMRFVDDLSLEEISSALNIPLGTAKSRLHHALRQLRDDPRTREYFE